jgi:Cytochrome c554 and c-prime
MTPRRPAPHFTALLACGFAALALAGAWSAGPPTAATTAPEPPLFAGWPKDAKPDAVLVVTGQTYGYLQPCGCSRPQLGGLERRANFIAGLRAKGWPVAAVDLGDILPAAGVVPEQVLLKYATTLPALREMGYVAVGVGKAEFANGLFQVLDQYAAKKEQPPYALAGNAGALIGGKVTPRADAFPGPGARPMVGLAEVADVGTTPVGVAGAVGPTVQKAVAELGPRTLVGFTPEKDALDAAVKELAAHPKKPRLNVLLYQGTLDEAKKAAKDWPQFGVVVCLSPDSEPPEAPETVAGADGQKTFLVRVGHKGRYVGVVGAFKRPDGGFDLKYELAPLGEQHVTPGGEDAARRANPALPLLDDYAARVKARNLMGKFPQLPPPGQAENPKLNLVYVGSEACAKCHAAESAKWAESKHAHALDALEKVAKRPSLRQYDGECVVCHTVGFGYKTGYRDELTTPNLKHVGCESCHGPGSGHAADPKDAKYLALQSPWRQEKADRLPDAATVEALAKLTPAEREKAPLRPAERRTVAAVGRACASCHDTENDPQFDLFVYWPKVIHPAKK